MQAIEVSIEGVVQHVNGCIYKRIIPTSDMLKFYSKEHLRLLIKLPWFKLIKSPPNTNFKEFGWDIFDGYSTYENTISK